MGLTGRFLRLGRRLLGTRCPAGRGTHTQAAAAHDLIRPEQIAEFTKLPKYMLEEERIKFSTEQRQLLLNPEKKPSKFFMRWYRDVIFPDSIKEKMEEVINR